MNKIIRLSFYELKKIFIRPYIYLGLLFAATAAFAMTYLAKTNSQLFHMRNVYAVFADISEIMIFIFAAKNLSDDIVYKTASIIFTKSVSRAGLVVYRIISLGLLGLAIGICLSAVTVISSLILAVGTGIMDILKVLFIYMLYSLCVGGFAILTTIRFKSFIGSFASCLGTFWFIKNILAFLGEKDYISETVLSFIPFYTASDFLHIYVFGMNEIIGLFAGTIIFMASAAFYIGKVDIY